MHYLMGRQLALGGAEHSNNEQTTKDDHVSDYSFFLRRSSSRGNSATLHGPSLYRKGLFGIRSLITDRTVHRGPDKIMNDR
jgi:hypothetical protein